MTNFKKNAANYEKMHDFVHNMRQNTKVLRQISDYNETMRRRYQADLGESKSKVESISAYVNEIKMNRDLYDSKYQILEESFKNLFNSIQSISVAKNLQDKYERKL